MGNLPEWLKIGFIFLLGLEFGSFANVCIYRWPRNSSVARPKRSFCPWCNASIHWFDNIPILSFVFLRGRCRSCRSPISIRYPVVEFSVALLWILLYRRLGPVFSLGEAAFMAALFALSFTAVVTTMTDLDWRQIPDNSTAILTAVGLAAAFSNPLLGTNPYARISESILGFAVGGGSLWVIGYAGERIFGKEAMGGGDVKLLAAMGTVVGWESVLATLFLGALMGGIIVVIGLLTGRLKRHQYVPFGPFLNLASISIVIGMGEHLKTGGVLGLGGWL
jgi:leader peptidase (prepilin peptidase)/N-methyltransferase